MREDYGADTRDSEGRTARHRTESERRDIAHPPQRGDPLRVPRDPHPIRARRLAPGDEALAAAAMRAVDDVPPAAEHLRAWLDEPSRHFVVALDASGAPIGRAYAYELPRPTRPRPGMVLYEIDTAAPARRRGAGRAMIGELLRIARERGVDCVWVPTNASSAAAMALYEATGASRPQDDDVLWTWDLR